MLEANKIGKAGTVVTSDMMVGFDSENLNCLERQFDFGTPLPVVNLRTAILVAPIATPRYPEMKAARRLFENGLTDAFPGGDLWTNIEPLQMSREQLAEGAVRLLDALLELDNKPSEARPEIAWDIASALTSFLNASLPVRK